jgi:hypothetical protein
MDRKLQQTQEIERLVRLGEAARTRLDIAAVSIRQRYDVPARLKDSLKRHPTGWLAGSLFCGLAASMLLNRKPPAREKKNRGLPLTLLGLSLTAVRPIAKVWLTDQVKQYFSAQRGDSLATQPHPRPPSSPII